MLTSADIRAEARGLLTGQWNNCAIIMFVYYLLMCGISTIPVIGGFGYIFITGPLSFGMALIYLKLARGEQFGIETLFKGLEDYMRTFTAGLLITLYCILWTLLLIVPGIIAGLSYSMTYFILNDNPNMSAGDAIKLSQQMMYGHKAELFILSLSFLGWFILSLIGFGIPLLWVGPYFNAAMTVFYQNISSASNEEITGFVSRA